MPSCNHPSFTSGKRACSHVTKPQRLNVHVLQRHPPQQPILHFLHVPCRNQLILHLPRPTRSAFSGNTAATTAGSTHSSPAPATKNTGVILPNIPCPQPCCGIGFPCRKHTSSGQRQWPISRAHLQCIMLITVRALQGLDSCIHSHDQIS